MVCDNCRNEGCHLKSHILQHYSGITDTHWLQNSYDLQYPTVLRQ
jgi:hypothetical protein